MPLAKASDLRAREVHQGLNLSTNLADNLSLRLKSFLMAVDTLPQVASSLKLFAGIMLRYMSLKDLMSSHM